MAEEIEIEEEKILLVEGKDDKKFFGKLIESLSKKKDVQIISVNGREKFGEKFSILLKNPKFPNVKKIAFLRDADDSAEDALKSIIDTIVKGIYKCDKGEEFQGVKNDIIKEITKNLNDNGHICKILDIKLIKDNIKKEIENNFKLGELGIYIMPNNKGNGALEDLCKEYMELKDPKIACCVNRYIKCIKEKCEIKIKNESKSIIHSYLSVNQDDRPSIGIAAEKGIFDFTNDCFNDIKNFLKKMYFNE